MIRNFIEGFQLASAYNKSSPEMLKKLFTAIYYIKKVEILFFNMVVCSNAFQVSSTLNLYISDRRAIKPMYLMICAVFISTVSIFTM